MKRFLLLLGVAALALGTVAALATASSGSHARKFAGTIKVMELYPDENPVTNLPDMKFGALAAAEAINKAGGVKTADGQTYQIEIDLCNEKNDNNARADCARQAVANGDVAVLTRSLLNAAPLLQQANIATIGATNNLDDLSNPLNWAPSGGSYLGFAVLGASLKAKGCKKMAIISYDLPSTLQLAAISKGGAKAAGLQYVGTVREPSTLVPDYGPYAQQYKATGADCSIIITNIAIAAANIRAIRALGATIIPSLTLASIGDPEAKSMGDIANGFLLAGTIPPAKATSIPAIATYNKQVDAVNGPEDARRMYGQLQWIDTFAFAAIVKTMKGTIDHNTFVTAMQKWPASKGILMNPTVLSAKPDPKQTLWTWYPNKKGPAISPRTSNGLVWTAEVVNQVVVVKTAKPVNVFQIMKIKGF